jgi:hypothetical protein
MKLVFVSGSAIVVIDEEGFSSVGTDDGTSTLLFWCEEGKVEEGKGSLVVLVVGGSDGNSDAVVVEAPL